MFAEATRLTQRDDGIPDDAEAREHETDGIQKVQASRRTRRLSRGKRRDCAIHNAESLP